MNKTNKEVNQKAAGLTEIIFIIDKSGSMQNLIDDTIGGFNSFVESQQEIDGDAHLTTVLFSSGYTKLHNHIDIHEVPAMDRTQYTVGGMTAMLDAIGETIKEVQDRIDDTPDNERPDKVICVIITDGEENYSRIYRKADIQKMINHQTKGHGWQFIFLGANMDAVTEASQIGINMSTTYAADNIGIKSVYTAVDSAVSSYRNTGTVASNWDAGVDNCTDYAAIHLIP